MQSVLIVVISCLCTHVHVTVRCQPITEDDRALLQDLLIQSKEQNRKLERQMKRTKMMWSGFQQLCSTFDAMDQCDCKGKDKSDLPDDPDQPDVKGNDVNVPVSLLRISSGGVVENGPVELIIVYRADANHTIDIMIPYILSFYEAHDVYRPVIEKIREDTNVYSAKTLIPNVHDARDIHFRILSGNQGIAAILDVNVVKNNKEQNVATFKSSEVKLKYTHIAPVKDNLTVSMVIEEDARDPFKLSFSDVEFNGLDTMVTPPKMFEIGSYYATGNVIKMEGSTINETTSWFNITIPQSYAVFGGLMTVLLPLNSNEEKTESDSYKNTGLIHNMYEVHVIEIILTESKKVVPDNTVGLYPFNRELMLYQEKGTVSCMAMGSPPPLLTLHRHDAGGKKTNIEGSTICKGPYFKLISYSVDKKDLESPKKFTCRAKSGSVVVAEKMTMKAFTEIPVTFDMAKTGVMKNTTDKVVFGCKASWRTNPTLFFRLYDSVGPVLRRSDGFKVYEKRIGKRTSKLTLTIAPRNDTIHTVYCEVMVPWGDGRLIELYPYMTPKSDWDLYNRLVAQQNTTRYGDLFDMY